MSTSILSSSGPDATVAPSRVTETQAVATTTGAGVSPTTTIVVDVPPPPGTAISTGTDVNVTITATLRLSALTTTFVPPTSCSNRYYATSTAGEESVITSGTLDPLFESCQADGGGTLIYSPGMCPGNMQTKAMKSNGDYFTEICCESGFGWDPRGCASLVATGSTAVPLLPASDSITTMIDVTSVVAVHSAITILWASSDLSLFPADVASRRSALFTTSNTTSNNNVNSINSINSTDSTSSKTGTGLSQPARIGIGLGVALGSIAIFIAVSAWLFKVRRRRKRLLMQPRNNAGELDGTQPLWKRFFGREWRSELDQDGPTAELAADPEPAELATSQVPVELPGSYRYREPAIGAAENKPGDGKVEEKQGDERKVDERANEKKDHERSAY